MKKVLIALDLDPTAQKVAEIGYTFAKTMEAEVILVHVMVDSMYYSSIENFPIMGYTGSVIAPLLLNSGNDSKNESQNYLDKIQTNVFILYVSRCIRIYGFIFEKLLPCTFCNHYQCMMTVFKSFTQCI